MVVIEPVVALDADSAVEALFASHYAELLGSARILLGDAGVADEVVQEAFARYRVAWRKLRDPVKGVAYLRSMVFDEAKRRSPPRAREEGTVVDALRALPRRQRECVVLRHWGGLSEAEIADALVVGKGSAHSHLERGSAALATMSTEDEVRRLLVEEAGATAPGHDALDGVRAAVRARIAKRHRNGLLVWAVAAVASVVGFVVIFVNADRSENLDVGPGTTTTASPGGVPVRSLLAVTDDGDLVLIDADTGERVRTLATGVDPDIEMAASDGYFTDDGALWRVPLAGGGPERLGDGRSPALSPDGRFLAYVTKVEAGDLSDVVVTRDLFTEQETTASWAPGEADFFLTNGAVSDLAWSPDGHSLAFVSSYEGREVRVHRDDDATLSDSQAVAGGFSPGWLDGTTLVYVHDCCFGDVPSEPPELRRVAVGGEPEPYESGAFLAVSVNDDGRVLAVTDAGITVLGGPEIPGDYLVADW